MQVLCQASNNASDVRCDVCGQGFIVYFTRTSLQSEAQARANALSELMSHHEGSSCDGAHPKQEFRLPEWRANVALAVSAPLWVDRGYC